MQTDKISICVINYNNGSFLSDLLDSIKNQTYKSIEVVFCDDKSIDDSVKRFGTFKESLPKNISTKSILRSTNSGGAIIPIMEALSASTGDYVCILDGDDYIHPQFLEVLHNLITSDDSFDISSVDNGCFRQTEEIKLHHYTPDEIKQYNLKQFDTIDVIPRLFMDSTIDIPFERWHRLYKREVISKMLDLPIDIFNTNGDSDISLASFVEGDRMICLDIPLHFWRINDNSVTHKSRIGFIEKYAYSGLGPMSEYYANKNSNYNFLLDLYEERQQKVVTWMFEEASLSNLNFRQYKRLHKQYVNNKNYKKVHNSLTTNKKVLFPYISSALFRLSPIFYYLSK